MVTVRIDEIEQYFKRNKEADIHSLISFYEEAIEYMPEVIERLKNELDMIKANNNC